MGNVNVEGILQEKFPKFFNRPEWQKNLFLKFFKRVLRISDINSFINSNKDKYGMSFLDEIFDHLNFSYRISNRDMQRIPAEGRLICVANHPIGSLDGLALIKLIREVRHDVKIVANDVLANFDNLSELFLPFDLYKPGAQRRNVEEIGNALGREEAVIFFPAAEVSRLKWIYVTDAKWHKGAISFAKKYKSPILPMFVSAKNSVLFYAISVLHRAFSTALLSHEMFNKKNKTITIKVGDPIPAKAFLNTFISDREQIQLLRKHVYHMGRGWKGVYVTEKNIIHPIDIKLIKKELNQAVVLGETHDNKKILLTDFESSPNVMNEIARLREITFRSVGEGTGQKLDLDLFDQYYSHLIVWDESELEIVGSYRLAVGKEIIEEQGKEGFYTATLFDFSDEFIEKYIKHGVELGRSFVQKRYWNTHALHYLWQGIGAFLAHRPEVKYLFGGVSISNSYPDEAKKRIVYYCYKWFGSDEKLSSPKAEFSLSEQDKKELDKIFTGENNKLDFRILRSELKNFGFNVPILYKHYSELCEDNGVKFLNFSVDKSFEDCLDGLILVNVDKVKDEKRQRYLDPYIKGKSASE